MTKDLSENISMQAPVCPLPLSHNEKIVMGHGSGGVMGHNLIRHIFLPVFKNPVLQAGDDSGVVTLPEGIISAGTRLAITTDSHVVTPLFFPGGDIGRLAVCGTVNDLAMMGARPFYLTAGFILEEGLALDTLHQVAVSMQEAGSEAGITIIAGDTKVVEKGRGDELYITTSGIGLIPSGIDIRGNLAQPGDVVIVSGNIGDHGIAVLAARGELGFETDVQSDIAPLNHLVSAILAASTRIHVLRDPTRGGLATTLNEIARQSQVGIILHEKKIPIQPAVSAACEMLGFDPLYVANEGKLVAIVHPDDAEKIITAMRKERYGSQATIVGYVAADPPGRVLLKTSIGSSRVVDMLAGEMLPRIC